MDERPAALASHLAGAGIGALAGAAAGVAAGFHFAPGAGLYLSAVNAPIFAGAGLMAGLASPEWLRGARRRLVFGLAVFSLASGCESTPATHFINGQLLAEAAREER